jgi:hypothetical protein
MALEVWIANCLKKKTCVMSIVFPSSTNKCELHVKTTHNHYVLSRYILSIDKWNLIYFFSDTQANKYVLLIAPTQFYMKKKRYITFSMIEKKIQIIYIYHQ